MPRTKTTARMAQKPNFEAKPGESPFIETIVKEEGVPDNTQFKDHCEDTQTTKRKRNNDEDSDSDASSPEASPKKDKYRVPPLDEDARNEMWNRIRPICESPKGRQYLKVPEKLNASFYWSRDFDGPVTETLIMCYEMYMICTYGYAGFFKPCHVEILSQIPSCIRSLVKAYEIVWAPSDTADLNAQKDYVNKGMHRFYVRLYSGSSKE